MKIIPYDDEYRDDMIFMVLQAKDALGKKSSLNGDLLTIQTLGGENLCTNEC